MDTFLIISFILIGGFGLGFSVRGIAESKYKAKEVKDEMQSRNSHRTNADIKELYVVAINTYNELWLEYPCEKQPDFFNKQPVDWRKLLRIGLIPDAPEDSVFDETMNKNDEKPFIYLIDKYGELTKEQIVVR